MRQIVGALLAPDASEDAQEVEIYLLYPVVAGSKGVYVVVDPMNEIVEADEDNNIKAVTEPLESPSPFFDVAGQVIGCLLYTSPSPRDYAASRMPSSA